MRKLKLQVQMSLDGFVAGPNGELDWMTWAWDDKLKKYVQSLMDDSDTILLGRKMTDGFVSHWANVTTDPENPEYESAKWFINTPKVVFTKTLAKSSWKNTSLAIGDITAEVINLKKRSGKDLIVYGGAGFVSSLIKNNLIDEYHLFINPAIIGNGQEIFKDVNNKKMKFVTSNPFSCGIVVNHYEPE